MQTAGTVTLGHFSFLVREGKSDAWLGVEGAPGLIVKAVECSLEKWFSFLPSSAAVFLSNASYFVLDESWKPRSLIEFSAISLDSTGGREQPVKAASGGVLDGWGEIHSKIRL